MCTACCYQMSVLTFIQIPCFYIGIYFVVVQSLSCVQLFVPLWTAARQASLSFTISQSLLKLTFIGSVIPSNSIFLFHPFLLLPPIFPSVRVFSNDLALRIRWQKYWSFILSLSPSMNIYCWFPLGSPGWISLQSKGISRFFSNTTVWKHQLFSTRPSLWSNSHIHTWLWEKP